MSKWFTADDRILIRQLADMLIPEAEGMPSASSVGACDALLDRVVHLRADLAPAILAALRHARGLPPAEALETLRKAHLETWQAFTLAIAGAYYLAPEVRDLLGYTGPERRPVDPSEPPDWAELLQPVIARGPIWRRA